MKTKRTSRRKITRMFMESLIDAGMRPATAEAKAELFGQCLEHFSTPPLFEPDAETYELFVPGRIEFLGKHTDYAGGRSLILAVDMGFNTIVRARRDALVRIRDVFQRQDFAFSLDALPEPRQHDWTIYPLTCAHRLVRNFPGPLRGADIAFFSDLPPAAGMSSSSAFVIAMFLALAAANNLEKHPEYQRNINSPEALAGYLATYENGQSFGTLAGEKGVGTFGGSEDHTAILCARPGHLVQYRYCPVIFERAVRVPEGVTLVVAVSGVVADKNSPETQAKYNEKSLLASHLARLWREATGRAEPHLAAILACGDGAGEELTGIVKRSPAEPFPHELLIHRLRQFAEENEKIIGPAGTALESADWATLGKLVDRSQHLAEVWLGTQVPETIWLAAAARELEAHAASSFGAGFGGSVWALVDSDGVDDFEREWQARYQRAWPETAGRAAFRRCLPGPAAFTMPIKF